MGRNIKLKFDIINLIKIKINKIEHGYQKIRRHLKIIIFQIPHWNQNLEPLHERLRFSQI